jgi:TAG lipase/steryl ester hydrolase/phospholipase A2/LPA acyltransferase
MPGGRQFLDGTIGADLPTKQVAEMFNVNNCIVSQTNPMIIPFMDHSHKFTNSRLYFHFFKFWDLFVKIGFNEVKHRFNQLSDLKIIPKNISRYFNLLVQEYSGDVTIAPVPRLWDLLGALRNPSKLMMEYFSKIGQTATFPKVPKLKQMLKIELKLDQLYRASKRLVVQKDFVSQRLFASTESLDLSK